MYLIPFQAGKQISKTASACWGIEHAAVGILFSYLHRCSLVFLRPSMQLKIYTRTSQHLLYRSEEELLCRGLGVLEDSAKAEDMLFKVPLFQNIQQQPQSFPTTEQADVFENYTYKTSWEAAGHALQPLSHAAPLLLSTQG